MTARASTAGSEARTPALRLLVLGASGGVGRWAGRMAAARGHRVRALVRPGTAYAAPPGLEVVRGEVLEPGVLEAALEGVEAVVSCLGTKRRSPWNPWSAVDGPTDLTARVARRLVEAGPARGVRRVVAVSAGGVGDSRGALHPLLRWAIDHSTLATQYADLGAMEASLEAGLLDWAAVRPTTLTGGSPTGAAREVSRYGLLSRVSRADVAAWLLDAVEAPAPLGGRTPLLAA